MAGNEFSKQLRLLRPSEFERVFAARASTSDGGIVVYGAANELEHPRLGLTVSRRIGNAVVRNRWKRLLRESFRLSQHELPAFDLVVVVRAPQPPSLQKLRETWPVMAARIERRLKSLASRANKKSS